MSLSSKFKKMAPLGDGKPCSVNLNLWMLTSKKKKRLLFDTLNKDFIKVKPRIYSSSDFNFPASQTDQIKIHKFLQTLQTQEMKILNGEKLEGKLSPRLSYEDLHLPNHVLIIPFRE